MAVVVGTVKPVDEATTVTLTRGGVHGKDADTPHTTSQMRTTMTITTPARLAAALAGFALVMTGCTASEPEAAPLTFDDDTTPSSTPTPSSSPTVTPQDTPDAGAVLVETGYMPVIVSRTEIPEVEVIGDFISKQEADDVYEWAASLAWLALNDSELRRPVDDAGEDIVAGLLPYLTDEATQVVLDAVRSWANHPEVYNDEVVYRDIATPMFFLPAFGEDLNYLDDPIWTQFEVVSPQIERIANNGTGARYRVDFFVNPGTRFQLGETYCQGGSPHPDCGKELWTGWVFQHIWEIVETGDPDAPYALDTWEALGPQLAPSVEVE